MFQVDIENLNPGTWFYFDKESPEDGGVCIRVISNEMMREIQKATQVWKSEVKQIGRGRPAQRFEGWQPVENAADIEFEMTWDYCIVDWKGVIDMNGTEIPCTKENKVKLMSGSVKFSTFIGECIRKLNEAAGLYEEEEAKN